LIKTYTCENHFVNLPYELPYPKALPARLERGSLGLDGDDPGKRLLRVHAAFDRDAQDGKRPLEDADAVDADVIGTSSARAGRTDRLKQVVELKRNYR
jgi:hypothetical protein